MDQLPPRPPRRSSTSTTLSTWGLLETWCATVEGRGIVFNVGSKGFSVTAIDPEKGERSEVIQASDDPLRAAMRAIGKFADA